MLNGWMEILGYSLIMFGVGAAVGAGIGYKNGYDEGYADGNTEAIEEATAKAERKHKYRCCMHCIDVNSHEYTEVHYRTLPSGLRVLEFNIHTKGCTEPGCFAGNVSNAPR